MIEPPHPLISHYSKFIGILFKELPSKTSPHNLCHLISAFIPNEPRPFLLL